LNHDTPVPNLDLTRCLKTLQRLIDALTRRPNGTGHVLLCQAQPHPTVRQFFAVLGSEVLQCSPQSVIQATLGLGRHQFKGFAQSRPQKTRHRDARLGIAAKHAQYGVNCNPQRLTFTARHQVRLKWQSRQHGGYADGLAGLDPSNQVLIAIGTVGHGTQSATLQDQHARHGLASLHDQGAIAKLPQHRLPAQDVNCLCGQYLPQMQPVG
jgi:hypothetical protein